MPVRPLAATLTLASLLLTSSTAAGAAPGDIVVTDRSADGRPDIVRLRIEHARGVAALVTVRVRNVRVRVNNELRLYLDPTGKRRRPSYAFTLGINDDGDWLMQRTQGWALRGRLGTCGERIRLRYPAPRERVVVFRLPYACFGDSGAKFAVRTAAFDNRLNSVGVPDWAPATRTLTRRFDL